MKSRTSLDDSDVPIKKAVINLQGADCPTCAYTIERTSHRIPGLREIHVDTGNHRIHISYNGEESVIQGVIEIIDRLGYKAWREQ